MANSLNKELQRRLEMRSRSASWRDMAVPVYADPNYARVEARESLDRLIELWPSLDLPYFPFGDGVTLEHLKMLRDAMVW